MEEISDIQKKYCSQAMIIAIAAAMVLIILGEKPIGKGLVLGTLFSVLNFIIMGYLISFKLASSRVKATSLAFISIFFRFGLLALPLIFSAKSEAVHFVGVAVGLFMIQLTILINHLVFNRFAPHNKKLTG